MTSVEEIWSTPLAAESSEAGEDFELINGSICPENSDQTEETESRTNNESRRGPPSSSVLFSPELASSLNTMGTIEIDPQTFVTIQREQDNMRTQILEQQNLLTAGFEAMKIAHEKKNREISDLNETVSNLTSFLETLKNDNKQLSDKVEELIHYRNEVDELTAKLINAEECVKYHEQVTKQFQTDGFVSIQPPMLTDQLLAKEMEEKDSKLSSLERKMGDLESQLVCEQDRASKAEQNNEELRGLIGILQEQAADNIEYLNEMRNKDEEEKGLLRQRIVSLERHQSSMSANGQSQQNNRTLMCESSVNTTLTPSAPDENSSTSQNRPVTDRAFTCDNCKMLIPDEALFLRHIERCLPHVDNID